MEEVEIGAGATGATDIAVERVVEEEDSFLLAGWKNCAGTVALLALADVLGAVVDSGATKPSETH